MVARSNYEGRKMLIARFLIAAAGLLLFSANPEESRADAVKIVSMEIGTGLQTASGEGLYAEMLSAVLRQSGQQYDYRVYPFKRAMRFFFEREADCIWALDSALVATLGDADADLIDSEIFFVSKQYIFMAPGTPAILSLSDLAGKRVGILNGSNLEGMLRDVSADVLYVADQDTKVRMLMNKRLDAIGGWLPDILTSFHIQGALPTSFNPTVVLGSSNVGIVCHASSQNLLFLEAINPIIKDFVRSRDFKVILKSYGTRIP